MANNNQNTRENHTSPLTGDNNSRFPLTKKNLKLMGVAFAVIVIGFLLMLGAPSTADSFNPDIYSFRRIILGPGIAFLGFIFMAYAIIKK